MWEVPRYRIRRYLRQVRKQRAEQANRPKPQFHIKRTAAHVRVLDGIAKGLGTMPACVILNDLSPAGLLLFTPDQLQPGQRVSLTLDSPKLFYARGIVTACKNISLHQQVFGENNFAFRTAIRFEFQNPDEERAVRRYCQEIYTRYLYGPDTF
jgi:hypothetical protein